MSLPPRAPERAHTRSHHGDDVIDEFAWMSDKQDPEFLAHLAAENAYTVRRTAHLERLREDLYGDILARTRQTDLSVPEFVRHTDGSTWWYYTRSVEGMDYPIHCRVPASDRDRLEQLGSLAVPTGDGGSVSLSQVAHLRQVFEDGIIWHRDRLPTITVRADLGDGMLPAAVTAQIDPTLDGIRAQLPQGYLLQVGGSVEDAARGQNSIKAGLPLFLLVVTTLLMLQLRSFSRTLMVLVTAPLGLIGATWFLLLFRMPFGFVAMLGTIALAGMVMRNSVILVDQIEQDIAAGHDRWHAIVDATVRRFRPIVLTALTAVLAMIPLSRSAFYGSMAVAIMGGLIVATALTLLFLPALYAAWFRVRPAEAAG